MPQFLRSKLSHLFVLSGSLTLWLTTPNLGKLGSRLCSKKVIQGKGNQNKTTCVSYTSVQFTGFHGYYLSSPASQAQMGITRRHLWLKIKFFWQIPTALARRARSRCKWGYLWSLTFEDIRDSAAKVIASQWKIPGLSGCSCSWQYNSPSHFLAGQGGSVLWPTLLATLELTLLGELRFNQNR